MAEILPTRQFRLKIDCNFLKALILILICFAGYSPTVAQSLVEEGRIWYQHRSSEADSFRVESQYIDKAIQAFEEALQNEVQPEESAEYLLRSYYFKGMFTGLNKQQKQQVFEKGKDLGERMTERFPNSVPIMFWYAANSGRWADVNGFFAAATNGLSKKLRRIGQDIIERNPEYKGGGGYRILAQVHYYSPNIPLVMGWPSNQKALELAEQALEIAPENFSNLLLYARILSSFDRNEQAQTYLNKILQLHASVPTLVEDRYVQHQARQLLQEQTAR